MCIDYIVVENTIIMPAKQDYNHIKLSYVTSFYDSTGSFSVLESFLKRISGYSPDLLSVIQFVVIDDCSNGIFKGSVPSNINLLFLRVADDIEWNISGARNLGATYARSDNLLMSDIDHHFPEATIRHLCSFNDIGRRIFRFRRIDTEGKKISSPPNILFMSRGRFLKYFGYDETFAGHYGSEDSYFRYWQRSNGASFRRFSKKHPVIADIYDESRREHSLVRDTSFNSVIMKGKMVNLRQFGSEKGSARLFLNFRWEILLNQTMMPPLFKPVKKPVWFSTWWLRALFSRKG
jgi:hypothetical protein